MDDKNTPIKYTREECKNCGRPRVELYQDGRKVCEKCHYNQETGEFDHYLFDYLCYFY